MAERCHVFPKYWELSSNFWLVAVARSKRWQRQTQRCLVLFLRECGWLVGCLQSVSTSCRMETRRFCLGNIQMPFHFGLCETFWSLPAEKQKAPQAWVCVFIGTSQLPRAKNYKKVLGSVLGGGNSRWTGCCFEPSPTVLQKKLNGKFVFAATKEKMHCFMLPVLYSNFTVVGQVNSWLFLMLPVADSSWKKKHLLF